jgi:hypothetical protein
MVFKDFAFRSISLRPQSSTMKLTTIITATISIAAAAADCNHGRLASLTTFSSNNSNSTLRLSWERPIAVQCGKFAPICYCFKNSAIIPDWWTTALSPQLPMLSFVNFDYQQVENGTRVPAMPAWPTVWHLSSFQVDSGSGKPTSVVVEIMENGIV